MINKQQNLTFEFYIQNRWDKKIKKIQEKVSELLNLNIMRNFFYVFGNLFTETKLSIMLYHFQDIKYTNIK